MCASFPFGFEGGMWDLIVLIHGHNLSIFFGRTGMDNGIRLDNPKQ